MNDYNDINDDAKPNAYRVDGDKGTDEGNLKKTFLGGKMKDADNEGMEGKGSGGHKFGEEGKSPTGDDKNNPSQNAGYSNEYFRRTEPSDERTEEINFKPGHQEGEPNYTSHRSDNDFTPRQDTGENESYPAGD